MQVLHFFAKGNALGFNVNSKLQRTTFKYNDGFLDPASELIYEEALGAIGLSYDYSFGYDARATKGRVSSVGVLSKLTSTPPCVRIVVASNNSLKVDNCEQKIYKFV